MIATILQSAVLLIIGGGLALIVCAGCWMLFDVWNGDND